MKEKKSKNRDSVGRAVRRWIICIIFMILMLLALVLVLDQRLVVSGSEMSPTLSNGDAVLLDTVSYRLVRPGRFDLVLIHLGEDADQDNLSVRRIVALPGETVQIRDGRLYINGELLEDDRISENIEAAGAAQMPLTLEKDEYFVLCDNTAYLSDSRDASLGMIRRDEMEGRAVFILSPLGHMGFVK